MGSLPADIPDLGAASQRLSINPHFDPLAAALSAEDYFVFSRVDGRASIRELILMSGLPTERAVAIVRRLRSAGALLLPGEPAKAAPAARAAPRPSATLAEDALDDSERASMAENVALPPQERLAILALCRKVEGSDYFELLGVERSVSKRELKRAYFRLSKEFHPDRYYGKELGSFAQRLASIFEAVNDAFNTLADERQRAGYLQSLGRGANGAAQTAQTPAEHAAELFEKGCAAETAGAEQQALPLFAAAIRVDPLPRYLRRAATCAKRAGRLQIAEEYARKAGDLEPGNPSAARLLAEIYRAAGRLDEAESTLQRALSLKSENDVLGAELAADLAAVRRLRAG